MKKDIKLRNMRLFHDAMECLSHELIESAQITSRVLRNEREKHLNKVIENQLAWAANNIPGYINPM